MAPRERDSRWAGRYPELTCLGIDESLGSEHQEVVDEVVGEEAITRPSHLFTRRQAASLNLACGTKRPQKSPPTRDGLVDWFTT
jgi:hypothetical protein